MEGSATKIRKSSSSIMSRMYVEGYDTSLSGRDFVLSMEEHFGSCGQVMHVYIPGHVTGRILNRFALMYLRGEGGEEKALKLNGSCMGGHKLVVEPYPFHATHLDHKFAPTRDADNEQIHTISVDGYDTSLPLEYAKSMLYEELSGCGARVQSLSMCQKENKAGLSRSAIVQVRGIDTLEWLLQLRGCDRKGLENIKIYRVVRPKRRVKGFSFDPKLLETSPPRIRVPHEDPGLPKPPCLNNLLPPAWKGLVLNTETEEIPASSALPASTSRYAPEDPSLPKPWKCLVDNSTGYGYFWNTETNVTQYQRPPSETNAT